MTVAHLPTREVPRSAPVIGYCDGACLPQNPGGCACSAYVIERHPSVPGLARDLCGYRICATGDEASNNLAEYYAAIDALRALYRVGYRGPVTLRSDSQLMVRQYTSEYGCHVPHLQTLLRRLRMAATYFESVALEWIPRAQNTRADALSRRAYYDSLRAGRRSA